MLKILLVSLLASLACAGTDIKILQDDREGFAFEAAFDPPAVSEVSAKDARFSVVAMKDLQTYSVPGRPQVPCRNCLIGLPPGAYRVSFSFGNAGGMSLKYPALPGESYGARQGRKLPEIIYAPDPLVYSSPQYPGHPGVIWKESRMGSQRVLHLTVFPVVYFPLKQSLSYQGFVRVTVKFSPSGGGFQPDAAYEAVLSRGLLNYKTARDFRVRPTGLGKASSAKEDWPFSGLFTKIYRINIKSSNEFSMDGEGFYRVTGSELQAAGGVLMGVDIDDIRVYAPSYGIALKAVYSRGVEDSVALAEVPVEVVDYNHNHTLDGNDQIRFYAQGGAAFVPTDSGWAFRNHPFDFYNHYWVVLDVNASTSSAKRLDTLAQDSTYDRRVESFPERIHRESNTYNPFRAGESYRVMWVWGDQMRAEGISLSDPVGGYLYDAADATIRVRPRVVTSSGNMRIDSSFMVILNNDMAHGAGNGIYESSALNIGGANTVYFGFYKPVTTSEKLFMDGYDFIYNRRLRLRGGLLQFYGQPGKDTLFGYAVSGFTDSAICLDVSDPLRPAYVRSLPRGDTAVVLSPGFPYGRDTLRGRKFCILTEAGLKAPSSVEWYSNAPKEDAQRNLRDPSVKFDYVVVCPLDFHAAARQLVQHRKEFSGDAVSKAVVVFVEDIYSQFSGGKTDISAIRNFLMFAHKYWNLRYAVLMGSGHFDFKGYMQVSRPNYIPPYEAFVDSTLLFTPMLSSAGGATDDFYGGYDADTSSPQVFVGRLPAGNADEALIMVNKIKRAETDLTISKEWRNRVLFMADDDQQLTVVDEVNSSLAHMEVTERAAAFFPLSMEKTKVYLQEYDVNPATREKPDAELALVDRINEGVLFWIFVGHGAFDKLTSESVFSLQYTLPRLKNVGKYGFFWAALLQRGRVRQPF